MARSSLPSLSDPAQLRPELVKKVVLDLWEPAGGPGEDADELSVRHPCPAGMRTVWYLNVAR